MNTTTRPMRIAIIAEFVRAFPSASSAWVPLLARELSQRGHHVTVLADGIEDPGAFGPIPVVVHRHGRIHHGCEPFGFRTWCVGTLRAISPQTTLSMTDHVAADLWLPLGPGPRTFLRSLRHTSLVGAAMDLAHRPYILLELLSQFAARRDAGAAQSRRIAFNADPVSGTLSPASLVLPTTSTLTPLAPNDAQSARESVRAALRIATTTPLLMLSINDHEAEYLELVFDALSQLRAHCSASPRLLLASRTPTFLRRRAAVWGVDDAILSAGTTHRQELLLAASDALIQPCPARAGESSGRLIANALAMRVPVLADATAAGSPLITQGAGIRLHAPTAASWRDALLHSCDPAWRARASAACHDLVPPLSLLVDLLEASLANAAAARLARGAALNAGPAPTSATA
jgi:hypothetical protein